MGTIVASLNVHIVGVLAVNPHKRYYGPVGPWVWFYSTLIIFSNMAHVSYGVSLHLNSM